MTSLNPRMSQATTLAIIVAFLLTTLASIRARGLYRTLLFILLGVGLPTLSEYQAINNMRLLCHHLQPQLKNVPLGISLAWYIAGYNTFTMLESLATQYKLPKQYWPFLLPAATALTATSMDLVTDVALLDQGYWEWTEGGPYAPEVTGPNGQKGIPIANYTGWLGLTSLVTFSYLLIADKQPAADSPLAHIESVKVGRQAGLLLLPSYLGAITWELRQRRWRYILYSLLFPLVLLKALLGR
jgi:uncharacterized membrane protein